MSREYYAKNRDRVRSQQREYRLANRERISARMRQYYEANREKLLDQKRSYHKENREKRAAYMREYYAANREKRAAYACSHRARNRAAYRAYFREHYRANRGAHNAKGARYKAQKIRATPSWSEREAIAALYLFAAEMGYHVDHIVPLRSRLVCGLHVLANLAVIRAEHNLAKNNRWWPDMWDRKAVHHK